LRGVAGDWDGAELAETLFDGRIGRRRVNFPVEEIDDSLC
jgi:hypothetical protein